MRRILERSVRQSAAIAIALLGLNACGAGPSEVEVGVGGPPAGDSGSPTTSLMATTSVPTSVWTPVYKPGQITDRYPTRTAALAALRETQEGGVLRRIDVLEAKLMTVEEVRRLAPGLDLPTAWPATRDVWVYWAEGEITNISSDEIDSWIIQVIGGPPDDPIYSARSGGPSDVRPVRFRDLPDRAKD